MQARALRAELNYQETEKKMIFTSLTFQINALNQKFSKSLRVAEKLI